MNSRELLAVLKDQVESKYNELGLLSLKGIKLDGKDLVVHFSDVFRSRQTLKDNLISDFQYFEELAFLSEDLLYVTSLLNILKENITDSSRGKYHQTWEDHIYLRYASFGFQVIYNYWDRLGDLLHLFFKTGLSDDHVYFQRVINNFPANNRSGTYEEMVGLYKSKVAPWFIVRNEVVHHFGLKTYHVWGTINNNNDAEKCVALQKEKESYADLFIEHLSIFHQAFILTVRLIEELPEVDHTDN